MSKHGKETQFDYLLNSLELASKTSDPAKHGYPAARRELFAYVRWLEKEVGVQRGELARLRDALDAIYREGDEARAAVVKHYGVLHRVSMTDLMPEPESFAYVARPSWMTKK